jgi:purine-nucleoside phosphorylase
MRLVDHVNLQHASAVFPSEAGWANPYDSELGRVFDRCAQDLGMQLRSGTYAGVVGPNYETAAEVRWLARSGIDAVGMSTVCEAAAAKCAGLRVLGLSCLTNFAAGAGSAEPLRHADVLACGAAQVPLLIELVAAALPHLHGSSAPGLRHPDSSR